jgi:hypothetical protein
MGAAESTRSDDVARDCPVSIFPEATPVVDVLIGASIFEGV